MKEKSEEQDDAMFRALDEGRRLASVSPGTAPASEFDHSLPLPHDDAMRLPELSADEFREEKENPGFKSYLQQIMDARRRRGRKLGDELPSEQLQLALSTSHFVIANTISGLPEYMMSELDGTRLAEPVAFGDLLTHHYSDGSDKDTVEHVERSDEFEQRRNDFISAFDIDTRHGDLSFQATPDHILSDVAGLSPGFSNMDDAAFDYSGADELPVGELDAAFSDHSASIHDDLLVLGHYTIADDDIAGNSANALDVDVQTDTAKSSDSNSDGMFSTRAAVSPSAIPRIDSISTVPLKRNRSESVATLPRTLVKGFVSLAKHIAPQQRKRKKAMPAPLLQLILARSNEFLDLVVLDLEAYAAHRGSGRITMKDAVLFLNRVRSRDAVSEVQTITNLAHTIFPLEVLLALDSSLQEAGP